MTELERYRDALAQIADEQKVYMGHGDYETLPALSGEEAQQLARDALIGRGAYGSISADNVKWTSSPDTAMLTPYPSVEPQRAFLSPFGRGVLWVTFIVLSLCLGVIVRRSIG